jgi:LmbE family N-acetylglucosaminyl deacetylase
MNRALIIAAHPDDDILGCGGVISKFRNKVEFKILFIGEGSTCRYTNPECNEAIESIEYRNSCAKSALELLGVSEYSFHNLPCGRLDQVPLILINKIIEKEILEFKPDTVFTHSNCDSNKDHVKVYDSTIISTRPGCGVDNVFSYEVLSSSEWGFEAGFSPNVFFQLMKKNVDDKFNALNKYLGEIKTFPFPRNEKSIITLATFRGMQSGNMYAEAFKLIRQIN